MFVCCCSQRALGRGPDAVALAVRAVPARARAARPARRAHDRPARVRLPGAQLGLLRRRGHRERAAARARVAPLPNLRARPHHPCAHVLLRSFPFPFAMLEGERRAHCSSAAHRAISSIPFRSVPFSFQFLFLAFLCWSAPFIPGAYPSLIVMVSGCAKVNLT